MLNNEPLSHEILVFQDIFCQFHFQIWNIMFLQFGKFRIFDYGVKLLNIHCYC